MTRRKSNGTRSLPLLHPFDNVPEFIRIFRTSLALLLLSVAAVSGQTKAVEAIKDGSSITYQINQL